jgi:DHA2 family multidrug resistance protein
MVCRFVPTESGDPAQAKPFDIAGFLLLGTGVICLISLLERGNRTFWFDDMHNILLLAGCLVAWAMFAAHLKMRTTPMLDLSVLSNRSFSAANTVNFLAAFMITGALFILPIFMQELLRFSPVEAGTSMAPRAFVMMFAFPFVGVLFNRLGPRLLITCGICLGFISAVLMSQLTAEAGWGDMILPQIIQGLSAAFVLGPVTTAALMQMSKEKMPGAAAIEAATRLLGSTLGVAVFASLLTHYEAVMWELVRHQISMSNLILYKRFKGLLYFFHTDSAPEALQKAYQTLNGRVAIQVMSLAYMNLFQLACAGFFLMLLISFFLNLKKAPN